MKFPRTNTDKHIGNRFPYKSGEIYLKIKPVAYRIETYEHNVVRLRDIMGRKYPARIQQALSRLLDAQHRDAAKGFLKTRYYQQGIDFLVHLLEADHITPSIPRFPKPVREFLNEILREIAAEDTGWVEPIKKTNAIIFLAQAPGEDIIEFLSTTMIPRLRNQAIVVRVGQKGSRECIRFEDKAVDCHPRFRTVPKSPTTIVPLSTS